MENPNRRCTGNFADKYLAGDVLKATCGAPIRVELMHRSTGDTPPNQDYKDIILEVSVWHVSAISPNLDISSSTHVQTSKQDSSRPTVPALQQATSCISLIMY